MKGIDLLLVGAIVAVSLVIALYFLRFWHRTGDTFFLWFSAAFALDALGRAVAQLLAAGDDEPLHYTFRLAAYALIVIAILSKNRRGR